MEIPAAVQLLQYLEFYGKILSRGPFHRVDLWENANYEIEAKIENMSNGSV